MQWRKNSAASSASVATSSTTTSAAPSPPTPTRARRWHRQPEGVAHLRSVGQNGSLRARRPGFHSNDGRGATTTVDPITVRDASPRADPLVQTYGAETASARWRGRFAKHASVWWLDVDSELIFVGDAGATEASRPSRRYGVEWANFTTSTKNWTVDADFRSHTRNSATDDPAGDHIPGSIESVISAGITYRVDNGFFGSVWLRYFGPRPLIEDDRVRSTKQFGQRRSAISSTKRGPRRWRC